MADYIGISKSLAVIGVTPKPEINYFYGPWESIEEALTNIPQSARAKGLTVGIIEGSEIVEYWFKNGVNLVLKSVDPELVYTTDETQQIIDSLGNTYVQKEAGKVLIPFTSLTKLNLLPTKEMNDDTYVAKETGKRLITEQEAIKLASSITAQQLSDGLDTKVTAVTGSRLITEQEVTKLASAVTSGDLEPYSLKNTRDLEEVVEVPKEEKKYIKFFDEVNNIEKKITMSNFILGVSTVYPTARTLVGEKNGKNEIFTSEYNYIAGSEKLNINGSIYYLNSGFYNEGNKIILSGAPIPEAGDFMFLEAIYLD